MVSNPNFFELFSKLHAEINRYYFGNPSVASLMSVALLADGHVLLEGVPGIAKTTLVKLYASLVGCYSKRIQFTPDLMPVDITGTFIPSEDMQSRKFVSGPVFTNILMADEINRATAKTQSALLEALEERTVTVEGTTYTLPQPFFTLATQNPLESAGTFPLPEASIDRFLIRIRLEYPNKDQELQMLQVHHINPTLPTAILSPQLILQAKNKVEQITVTEPLLRYVLNIVRWTRKQSLIERGASPRAGLALLRASKAHALLAGKTYVTPDDVKFVAPFVLGHRLKPTMEAEMQSIDMNKLILKAISEVPVSPV